LCQQNLNKVADVEVRLVVPATLSKMSDCPSITRLKDSRFSRSPA